MVKMDGALASPASYLSSAGEGKGPGQVPWQSCEVVVVIARIEGGQATRGSTVRMETKTSEAKKRCAESVSGRGGCDAVEGCNEARVGERDFLLSTMA